MEPILRIDNLKKQYAIQGNVQRYLSVRDVITGFFKAKPKKRKFWALDGINLELNQGETLGIIGKNGAGKSTLLKVLSKITPPTEGEIRINGRVASLLEVGTGFHPELTGTENIYLNGSILGLTKKEIDASYDEIVAFSGVEKFLATPLKHYSSGMQLRLAFAVAAHLNPEILMIDEILAVGDAEFQRKCLGKMDEVSNSGRTVLFVSHNLGAIRKLCERSILINEGKLIEDGPTNQVIGTYMNLIKNDLEVNLENRLDRGGNGDIRITGIHLFDQQNMPIDIVHSGDSFNIQLDYKVENQASPYLENLAISIQWVNYRGEVIFSHHNKLTNRLFQKNEVLSGSKFVITIKDLPLPSGSYLMHCNALHEGLYLDRLYNIKEITVEHGSIYANKKNPPASMGAALINADWTIH